MNLLMQKKEYRKRKAKDLHQGNFIAGFTIVEVIIYLAITGMVLTFLMLIYMNLMDSREKINAHHEVGVAGRYIMEVISKEVHNARAIDSPLVGNTSNSMSLIIEKNPTKNVNFNLIEGSLFIENTADSTTYKLNTNLIKVKEIEFSRINNYLVTVDLLLEYDGYSNIGYNVEEKFRTSLNTMLFDN